MAAESPIYQFRHDDPVLGRGLMSQTRLSEWGKLVSGYPDVKMKAQFIQPMLLQPTEKLAMTGSQVYELKLDGFRSVAIKSGGRVQLRSRNNKDFNIKYPAIVQALAAMPDETVIDGEIVARRVGTAIIHRAPEPRLQHGRSFLLCVRHDDPVRGGRHERAVDRSPRTAARRVLAKLGEPVRESQRWTRACRS